jgi:hypothetical protein
VLISSREVAVAATEVEDEVEAEVEDSMHWMHRRIRVTAKVGEVEVEVGHFEEVEVDSQLPELLI